MGDNWINIEDEAGMLDCEIDEVVEGIMNNRLDDGGDDDSEGGRAEPQAQPQAPLPKLGHQEAKDMVERLLSHAMQNNFPEDTTQGLQKYAKELERQNLNKTRSQSSLKSFFRPKANQPPK